jgi:hypothetical protein
MPSLLGVIYPSVLSLATAPIGAGGTHVIAGTFLLGVWRRPASEIMSVQLASSDIPAQSRLEQNYPNPFNPTTRIPFMVRESQIVSLKVYDVLGREVATLVNESLTPGSYEVTFDAAGLASGVYIYRLRAGDFAQTRKLVVQR